MNDDIKHIDGHSTCTNCGAKIVHGAHSKVWWHEQTGMAMCADRTTSAMPTPAAGVSSARLMSRTIDCPTCGVRAGEKCISRIDNRPMPITHASRKKAVSAAPSTVEQQLQDALQRARQTAQAIQETLDAVSGHEAELNERIKQISKDRYAEGYLQASTDLKTVMDNLQAGSEKSRSEGYAEGYQQATHDCQTASIKRARAAGYAEGLTDGRAQAEETARQQKTESDEYRDNIMASDLSRRLRAYQQRNNAGYPSTAALVDELWTSLSKTDWITGDGRRLMVTREQLIELALNTVAVTEAEVPWEYGIELERDNPKRTYPYQSKEAAVERMTYRRAHPSYYSNTGRVMKRRAAIVGPWIAVSAEEERTQS